MNVLKRLDTRRQKRDGTYPIILRISSGETEETLSISTGYSVKKGFWNFHEGEIKKSFKEYGSIGRVNNILSDKRKVARDVIVRLDEAGELATLSIHEVRDRINSVFMKIGSNKIINELRKENIIPSDKKREEILGRLEVLVSTGELSQIKKKDLKIYFTNLIQNSSFLKYLSKREVNLREKNKIGTADTCKDLGGVLRRFVEKEDLYFNDITFDFLKKMEAWHLNKGNSINGFAAYIRTFRASYNYAAQEGFIDGSSSPFLQYKAKKIDTDKRSIDKMYVSRIVDLKLDENDPLVHARNYFATSYFTWGMSFIDMAFMPPDAIVDGRIKYKRSKTSRLYNIKLGIEARTIIDFYLQGREGASFIFPIISQNGYDDNYADMKRAKLSCELKLKSFSKKQKSLGDYQILKNELLEWKERLDKAAPPFTSLSNGKGFWVLLID